MLLQYGVDSRLLLCIKLVYSYSDVCVRGPKSKLLTVRMGL